MDTECAGGIEDIIIYTTKPCFMTMATMGYFGMIHILSKYMKGKNAYSLKYPMLLYNNAQIVLNIYMAVSYTHLTLPTKRIV